MVMYSRLHLQFIIIGVTPLRYNILRNIFIFLLLLLMFVLTVFGQSGIDDTGFYDETGISEDDIECDTGCTYYGGTLTMEAGSTLTLDEIPDDLIIEVSAGATVIFPGGETLTSGTLDTDTMTVTNGELILEGGSNLDLTFEETYVVPLSGVQMYGAGEVEDGIITHIKKAEIQLRGSAESVYIENLDDPKFVDQVYVERAKGMEYVNYEGSIVLEGTVNDDTRIGSEGNYIRITDASYGDKFYYTDQSLFCQSSCNYDVTGNPNMMITGSDIDYQEEGNREEGGYYSYDSTRRNTRTVSFSGGEEHVVEGNMYVAENSLIIYPEEDFSYVRSVDGVYITAPNSLVQVFFDHDVEAAGNYVILDDETFTVAGSNYVVAFGDIGGSNSNEYFPYRFTEQNRYFDENVDDSSFRLQISANGGKAHYNSDQLLIRKPGISVLNGVNAFVYDDKGGRVGYDYIYATCNGEPTADEIHASCGELDLEVLDGGRVNVVTEEGVPQYRNNRDVTLVIESEGVKLDDGYVIEPSTHEYALNTGKVYLVGYKGGAAAAGLYGEGEEQFNEWGHVGLLYYKDNQWWVAEEDGASAKIRPVDESIFSGRTNGVWEIEASQPQLVVQAAEEAAGSDYKSYKPENFLPFGEEGITGDKGYTCSGYCSMAMYSGGVDMSDHSVSFADLESEGIDVPETTKILQAISAEVEPTPRWLLIDNPSLTRIPDNLDNEEIVYYQIEKE
jgi:hypothetical protein